jgi:hypothetical protein
MNMKVHNGIANQEGSPSKVKYPDDLPVRDVLLWSEELRFLQGGTDTQGAGAEGDVLHGRGLGRRGRHCSPGNG